MKEKQTSEEMFQIFSKFMTQWQNSHELTLEKETPSQEKIHAWETEGFVVDPPSAKHRVVQGPCSVEKRFKDGER